MGRKLSKQVENTAGKGEIARYEQFLLFPHCFQKACFPGASKGVIVWEWVNTIAPLPKVFASTKLKAFTNDQSDVAEILISIVDRLENFVGKEKKNCW